MRIIDFERAIHIFVEPSINAWVQNVHWLMDIADWVYLNGHFFVTVGGGRVHLHAPQRLLLLRPQHLAGLDGDRAGRLLAVPDGAAAADARVGLHRHGLAIGHRREGVADNGPAGAFVNTYAAVPSMHICFALIIGVLDVPAGRGAGGQGSRGALYPVLVTFVVIATANHFFIDVFLGALTAGAVGADRQAPARPSPARGVWAFGRATA